VSGSQLKWLSVVDEYTRECLALKVDRGITSEDVGVLGLLGLSKLFQWKSFAGPQVLEIMAVSPPVVAKR
jgi:hypothetical protein